MSYREYPKENKGEVAQVAAALARDSYNWSPFLALYRSLTGFGSPLIHWYLKKRLQHGKEDQARFGERLGRPSQERPPGSLLWLHAASIGESLSVLPLVRALLDGWPVLSVLMTTGSVSSARIIAEYLSDLRVYHQYLPVDRVVFFQRFLDYWRPALVLWVESEFWPNAILEIRRRNIPMVLINGRLSERSFQRWRLFWPQGIRSMLASFDLCLGQTWKDCQRLSILGARRTGYIGNLKFSAQPLPADPKALAIAQNMVVGRRRPVWLAASTHASEEATVGRIHQQLVATYPELLTIIVPRHPLRGLAIAAELATIGLRVARRSANETVLPEIDIYIADTFSELGLFFRLVPLVFIGKSLVPRGGQNPLEPARLGCAVLFGPYMSNFLDISTRMVAAGAARTVADEADLSAAIENLLSETTTCVAMGVAGQMLAGAEAVVLPRLLIRLTPYLEVFTQRRSLACTDS